MGRKFKTEIKELTETAGTVSWSISINDRFDIDRIDINLSAAPTSAGSLTVTRASSSQVLRTVDMVGVTDMSIENLGGFAAGDSVTVAYANPDFRTINGDANVSY